MSIEKARRDYRRFWRWASMPCDWCRPSAPCDLAQREMLMTDAASISLDLAVAEASIERTRRSVAW